LKERVFWKGGGEGGRVPEKGGKRSFTNRLSKGVYKKRGEEGGKRGR